MESVVDTGADTAQSASSDPTPDDPRATEHDHDADAVQVSDHVHPDEAVEDAVGADASLTDEPAMVEPGIPDPAVEDDVVATTAQSAGGGKDRNAIRAQRFDPVEDAETPAPEPADALIEAMLGPAAIEIEAATETSAGMTADPVDEPSPEARQSAADSEGNLPDRVIEDFESPIDQAADPMPPPPTVPVRPASAPRKTTPSFVRRPSAAGGVTSRRRWLAAVAIALLTLALLLQLLLADRARLAADARWRPALSTLCGALHCTLPPWREAAAFSLLRRDVRPHPTIDGALRVTATFRNDARWAQPWPGVLLTLSDVDGRVVAARTFLPREYLDTETPGAAATQTTLASGHSKAVVLDIVEPTPRIVAFTFDFQ